MIQTMIGVARKPANKAVSDWMQTWLEAHGLGVYTPHVMDGESANLATEYDLMLKGLKWKASTVAHLAGLKVPPSLMGYGGYFSGAFNATTWKTIHFPDRTNPAIERSQDELTLAELTSYLSDIRLWLANKGIVGAMFMDEPAHKADVNPPNPGLYGWSADSEARNIKWAYACVEAGFELRVAMPGPSQLRYWLPKLPPSTTWVLHEKHEPAVYRALLPAGTQIWIYNVRAATLPKLTQRLEAFRNAGLPPQGVLMWNAVPWVNDNDMPLLFDLSGAVSAPTEALYTFIAQLTAFDKDGLPPVVVSALAQRVATLETDRAVMVKSIADLIAQVAVLENPAVPVAALQEHLDAIESRVTTLEAAVVAPSPVAGQPVDLALFYSDDIVDWKRELATLATYPTVVVQAEFATTTATSAGEPYALGRTPLAMLKDNRVDVMLYVSPWWIQTEKPFGGPGEWLRAAQRAKLDATKGWLMDRSGIRVDVFDGRMSVADPRKAEYVDWLAQQLIALPHDKLFIDNAFWHQGAYHDWLVSDAEWGAAVTAFYAKLRAAGKHLVLNAGWEPATGEQPWAFPLRDYCDGVGIEMPAGFKSPPAWDWWALYDYKPMDTTALEAVALDWKAAGKDVYLIASGHRSNPLKPDETPFVTLAEHRAFWRTLAKKLRVSVSAQESASEIPDLEP